MRLTRLVYIPTVSPVGNSDNNNKMDNQSYGLIQENLSDSQRCYCDDGFSSFWTQAKQLVLESEKTDVVTNGVCIPSHDPRSACDDSKVRFSVNQKLQNKLRRQNKVNIAEDVGSRKKDDKTRETSHALQWAFKRTEKQSDKALSNKDSGKVSSSQYQMSLKNKRELLKKRHSDPTMPRPKVIPIQKPRSKSEGHILKGIPSYVRKAWEKMAIDSSEDAESTIQCSDIKSVKQSGRDSTSSNRHSSLGANHQSRLPTSFNKQWRRYSDPGAMTYVEEREATLRSLRSTSFSTKQTILQRVSIANGLNFSEIRNKSNCFSKKAVSLIAPSNSRSSTPISSVDNSETLVDKAAKTFPLHMMMTTEDAIYGLSYALNVARRNQHLLDKERLNSEKSQIPDLRFLRLELALLRLNDEKTQK